MNDVLAAVLLLEILLFAFGIYRMERALASYSLESVRPRNLKHVLDGMLHTVRAEGSWSELEFMREEVRQALRTLDDMRHDSSHEALRASKRQVEPGGHG